jgi:hypothetical protein
MAGENIEEIGSAEDKPIIFHVGSSSSSKMKLW